MATFQNVLSQAVSKGLGKLRSSYERFKYDRAVKSGKIDPVAEQRKAEEAVKKAEEAAKKVEAERKAKRAARRKELSQMTPEERAAEKARKKELSEAKKAEAAKSRQEARIKNQFLHPAQTIKPIRAGKTGFSKFVTNILESFSTGFNGGNSFDDLFEYSQDVKHKKEKEAQRAVKQVELDAKKAERDAKKAIKLKDQREADTKTLLDQNKAGFKVFMSKTQDRWQKAEPNRRLEAIVESYTRDEVEGLMKNNPAVKEYIEGRGGIDKLFDRNTGEILDFGLDDAVELVSIDVGYDIKNLAGDIEDLVIMDLYTTLINTSTFRMGEATGKAFVSSMFI